MDTVNLGMREAGLFEIAKDAVQLEFERVEAEFKGLSVSDVEECLKCLVACGCDSFVKESAAEALRSKQYQHYIKLEVLAMREKIQKQKWEKL